MNRIAIINVVGLTESHLGEHTPHITAYANSTSVSSLTPPLPAVTSTVQSSMLTGTSPAQHGIVANGWYERNSKETFFWRQANSLVEGEPVWDALKAANPTATVANICWWFNMYSSVDYAVTPRPMYPADGRKLPDIWTNPSSLRESLQQQLGSFPLFKFWGPTAGIESSKWIANAAIEVDREYSPTLSFVYLPHLDYPLQKLGPNHEEIPCELGAIDQVVGSLIRYYSKQNIDVCILSEYGIEEVNDAIAINKVLRQHNLLAIRQECNKEYLDAGASDAFAVPDHQVAHVYVRNTEQIEQVARILQEIDGIEFVYSGDEREELVHERSGEIIVVAEPGKWFSHDWWIEESRAPDYQGTVDIHRKPGYDPRELCLASGWRGSVPRMAMKLLLKKLGQRTLFDVITLDPTRVKGSHGRTPSMGAPSPILIAPQCAKKIPQSLPSAVLKNLCLEWVSCS